MAMMATFGLLASKILITLMMKKMMMMTNVSVGTQ